MGHLLKFNRNQSQLAFGYKKSVLSAKWEVHHKNYYIMKQMGT